LASPVLRELRKNRLSVEGRGGKRRRKEDDMEAVVALVVVVVVADTRVGVLEGSEK